MTVRYCSEERPKVYVFVGDQPWDVLKEAAKFLRKASKVDEYFTQLAVALDTESLTWVGTLTTNGAGAHPNDYVEGYAGGVDAERIHGATKFAEGIRAGRQVGYEEGHAVGVGEGYDEGLRVGQSAY